MYNYEKSIMELCQNDFQRRTLEDFCKAINHSDADLFVVMAHKAALLYQVLFEQGFLSKTSTEKIFVTNHSLDYNCDYLKNKKIAVIDDIVISGTALSSTVNKLIDLGIEVDMITIITLAIDKKYFAMDFSDCQRESIIQCNTLVDDETCIELSYSLSTILSFYGLPYDTEFPIYESLGNGFDILNKIYNNVFWKTYKINEDINTYYSNKNKVESYVLIPTDYSLHCIFNDLNIQPVSNIHIKYRVYIHHYTNGEDACYIMPLFLFDSVSENNVNQLFDIIVPKNLIHIHNNSNIAKVRFLQYYFSHRIYNYFKKSTNNKSIDFPKMLNTTILFGKNDGEIIHNILLKKELENKYHFNSEHSTNDIIIEEYVNDKKINIKTIEELNEYEINYTFLEPFLWWYENKELFVRNYLSNNPKHFIHDKKEISKLTYRLNSGFSHLSLKKIIQDKLGNYDCETEITLFIDMAIDSGMIVPTLYHDKENNILCRAYRHGEDLPFALADEYRLLLFIKQLSEKIPNINSPEIADDSGISQIVLEKMIVLFYQFGLKQGGVFNRFLGFDNTKILRHFLSIHGRIEGFIEPEKISEKPHFYSERDKEGKIYITWLSNWLLSNNYIINKNDHLYLINANKITRVLYGCKTSCISDSIKLKISSITSIISTWYNKSISDPCRNLQDDIIALTSCSDEYVYASAIATEIHYFYNFWNNQAKKTINDSDVSDDIKNKILNDKNYSEQYNKTMQGLYSGINKVKWYNTKMVVDVIEYVSSILDANGKLIWNSFWNTIDKDIKRGNDELRCLIHQSIGLLYFYYVTINCLCSTDFWDKGTLLTDYEKYKSKYIDEECYQTSFLNPELFSKLEQISQKDDFELKKTGFISLIETCLINSEKNVERIEKEMENSNSIYNAKYHSVLYFKADSLNEKAVKDAIIKVWENELDSDLKTQINAIEMKDSSNSIYYEIFYGISNNLNSFGSSRVPTPQERGDLLISIFNSLCLKLDGRVSDIKAILIPDIFLGLEYKINTYYNIEKNTKEFNSNSIDLLTNAFVSNTKKQLVIAKTMNVNRNFYDSQITIWDHSINKTDCIKNRTGYSSVTVYYDDYIKYDSDNERLKNVTYSIVGFIKNDSMIGTGLLINTINGIVCITCNHILSNIDSKEITAAYAYGGKIRTIGLAPLKEIIKYVNSNQVLPPQEELAILIPHFNGKILFDFKRIISIDDLDNPSIDKTKCNLHCCAYLHRDFPYYNWSDPFTTDFARLPNGYISTSINKNTDNPVTVGFSGGIVTLLNDHHTILGIHEGRTEMNNNDIGRMIPCKIIKEVINNVKR